MDINRGGINTMLDIFFTEARAEWTEAMNGAKENLILNKVAMQVSSKTSQTRHAWLNQLPAMRKWVGDRTVNNLQSNTLNIANSKFENTLEISREEFEDDEYSLYKPLFPILGRQATATKDRLLIDACLRGGAADMSTNDTWGGDGVAVFSTSGRTYGSNTINNKGTTGFDSLGVQFGTAWKAQSSYLGHKGQPLMVKPSALVHGPNLFDTVHKAIKNQFSALATGAGPSGAGYVSHVGAEYGNPWNNIVELVVTEYLVDNYIDLDGNTFTNAGKAWFLAGSAMGVKAGLVYQSRIEPELQDQRARFDASADVVFLQDKLQWGVRMRGAGFIGLPHLIWGSFPTSYGT